VGGIRLVSAPSSGKDCDSGNERHGPNNSSQRAESLCLVWLYGYCGGLPCLRTIIAIRQSKIELKANQYYAENDQCDAVNPAKLHRSS
jgi:hypothetical protein